MFITLEDETGIGNLIVWPSVFEKFRRAIVASSMLGCRGKVQREGEVTHVIAEHLVDLSGELRRVSKLDQPFRWPAGRGDAARQTRAGSPPAAGAQEQAARYLRPGSADRNAQGEGAGFPVSFLAGGAAKTFPQISCSWKSDMPPDQPHPATAR